MENENMDLLTVSLETLKSALLYEDNVPADGTETNALILRSKMDHLLTERLNSGKILSYLGNLGKPHTSWGTYYTTGPKSKMVICNTPETITPADPTIPVELNDSVSEFYIALSQDLKDENGQRGPIRLRMIQHPEVIIKGEYNSRFNTGLAWKLLTEARDEMVRKYGAFRLLSPHSSKYTTIRDTCHYFGILPQPYAAYDKASGIMTESFLHTDDEVYWDNKKAQNLNRSEAAITELDLNRIIERYPDTVFRDVYSKACEGWFKQVFTFNDEFGYPVMKAIRKYDYQVTGTTKSYVPVTKWCHMGKAESVYQTIPLPKGQILYNLDKVMDAQLVIICPDLEIADALQSVNSQVDVAYTTFLCDEFKQVDFSPLKDKEAAILTMNHSGLTLAQVYAESEKLYKYLQNSIKVNRLKVIQASAVYPDTPKDFSSVAQFMEYHREHKKPYIVPGSVIVMETEEEFMEMVNKAQTEIERKAAESQDKQFWAPAEEVSVEPVVEEKADPSQRELIRAFAARGCITYLDGATHIGKSNFIASLCAYAVNPSQRKPEFLSERCWTVCKTDSKYKTLKIMHLDFENGQAGIDQREMDFVDPYMPDDEEARKACKANYIVKDLSTDAVNYSDAAHFEDLCRMIDDCSANDGEKGQPVDILVIDTYWAFVHQDDSRFEVIRKIIASYPDMAIIVLHHLNGDGKSYGRKDKDFGASVVLHMDRKDNNGTLNLNTPFQITVAKNRLSHLAVDLEPFSARLDEKGHFAVVDPKHTKAETVRGLKEGYKEKNKDGRTIGISNQKLAERLGMGVSQLENLLKTK